MMTLNQIGFHFVDNQFTEAQINQHFGLLNDTRPAAITILGGAQYKEALDFAKRAKQHFPQMRVVFRHYKDGSDDGMHTRLSADEWWEKIGKLYVGTNLTILADNESMAGDLTYYAQWHARIMQLAGAAGVGIGYGAFSTHNPPVALFPQLRPMFEEAAKWGDLHTYSAHVYWTADNLDGFKYIEHAIQVMRGWVGRRLSITVGEYALLRDIRDAHHGWHSANVSGKVFTYDAVIKAKVHLPGIPVCLFSIGQWPLGTDENGEPKDTFSLDKDGLETIKHNLTPITVTVQPPPLTIITFTPDDPRWLPAIAQTTVLSPSEIKAEPFVLNRTLDTLTLGVKHNVAYIPVDRMTDQEKVYSHDGSHRWYPIKMGTVIGWIRSDWLTLTAPTLPPQTTNGSPVGTPPIPDPPAPPVIVLPPAPPTLDTAPVPVEYITRRQATIDKRLALLAEELARVKSEMSTLEDEKAVLSMALAVKAA